MPKSKQIIKGDQLDYKKIEEMQKKIKEEFPMKREAIPNTFEILSLVEEMLNWIYTPEMQELEKTDRKEFELRVAHRYNTKLSMNIINQMVEPEPLRTENLEILMDMMKRLDNMRNGADMEKENEIFQEKMRDKYLYPAFGSKEEFEKKFSKK